MLPYSKEVVEALAIRKTNISAKDISIFDTIFEGDTEVIIKILKAKEVDHPIYDHILENSLSLFLNLRSISFLYVKRLSNSVAHYLAEHSKFGEGLQVWIKSIPNDIAHLVIHDSL